MTRAFRKDKSKYDVKKKLDTPLKEALWKSETNLRFYEQKSLALEKFKDSWGKKPHLQKNSRIFGGKSLASYKFFLAPLISKSYLPPW